VNDVERFKFSFRNAKGGLLLAFRTQRNLRIHFIAAGIAIAIAPFLQVSMVELLILLLTILIVLATELINTAIEFSVDLISPEFNHLAKKAKDVSAAAVLIAAIFAAIIGVLIFLPKAISVIGK
jgi:diacylglycerol kinase